MENVEQDIKVLENHHPSYIIHLTLLFWVF